jgi:cytochrome c oxidase subunit I+III
LAGPWRSGLDPALHVYPAIVWVLVIWIAAHAALGTIMQLYALARSFAGRMTREHDGDVRNISVYEHFLALSALIAFLVIGFFPRLA